ncbi:histone-lysine N-methyltransferase NSD2-like [Littorina saxatilis]|uniref:Histone-lysine N-methyltransferase NSD2 n=1 Tax=Littorina saxatilis TaxID=31220 RepID=A0AAN9BQX3_9CAEN
MSEKTNGLTQPQGTGFHRLPQIPMMSRSSKIKTSAKVETVAVESVDEGAVIHIEGTDKVVKINSEGLAETISSPPAEPTEGARLEGENGQDAKSEKKTRKRQRSSKLEPELFETPKGRQRGTPKTQTDSSSSKKREKNAAQSDSNTNKPGKNTSTPSAEDAAEEDSETPRSRSAKRGARTAPKANAERKERRSTVKTGQPTKSAQNDSDEQSQTAEQDSTTPADTNALAVEGASPPQPGAEAPVSVIRSILESAPLQGNTDTGDEQKMASAKAEEVPATDVSNGAGVDETESSKPEAPVKQDVPSEPKEKAKPAEEPKMYFSSAGRILPRTVLLRESEKPSDSQLARIMEGKTNEFDVSHPIKWRIGDLLWGHVSGHPWWPGMVSSDPFSGLFTTIKGGCRISRLYHVQYFGDEAERGWVGEASAMKFEGKQKLLDIGAQQIKVTKDQSKKKKLQQAFCPNQRRKAPWELAVDEGEDALTLDVEERIEKYTFVYEFLPNKKTPKAEPAGKRSTSPASSTTEKLGLKRKEPSSDSDKATDDEEQESSAPKRQRRDINTPASQKSRRREEGSFETFCIKHREFVREEHPEYSGGMVIEALKQQWTLMTPQHRLRYKSKFSSTAHEAMDEDTSTGSSKRSPRKSRPSLKKLEAEEDKVPGPKQSRPEPDGAESTPDMVPGRKRNRKSAVPAEEEQTPSEASVSVKSKSSNDSDSNSDFQDEARQRSRPPKIDEDYVLEIFKLNNTGPTKKENLCAVCDQNGELLECHGVCQNYFHAACVDLTTSAEEFKCQECLSGEHKCFFCKKGDKNTKKCAVSQCGKFYHEECVKKMINGRFEGKGFTCPHHICATCAADVPRNPKSIKGRLYRCVRCPTAYHVGDFCVAAGSIHLGGYHILCSNHFQPVKGHKHHLRINVSWCFSCSKGGSLVCCETCPAAFHTECANLSSMPEDAWYCSDCLSGKKPLYGDIIWIKIGNYRWWPAEICHPRSVPTNIQEMAHHVGEFPARFFGSHDYYWTHQGRVFQFQEGDRGSKDTSASRGLFKMYYKGVKEATEAFKLWKAAKENKEQLEQEKNDRKPAPFKFVKANVPFGNVQLNKADPSEIPRCECKPDQENPCGSDTECLNRMLMYECNPNVCPAKEACNNQRFQKRQYPENAPHRTEARGWGLKTIVDVKKGQFVNEYVGDLIDEEECKRRIKQAHDDNITNFYMLTVDKNRIIDAGPKGNNSRFMNHSCEPNLETQKWMVNGDVRVGLFAVHDIAAGSELTFNYNLECLGNEKTKCACGAENCSGFLGVRPKTQAAVAVERKKKEKEGKKRKRRKHPELKKGHEDECFRCTEGGELVMCDKPNCPKVYHLQCLNLAKPPHGKWLCPWHHCDVCGERAVKLCTECPNSFCQQHFEGVITVIKDKLICAEHTELIEGLAASASESTSVQSSSSSTVDSEDETSEPGPPTVKKRKPEEGAEEEDKVGMAVKKELEMAVKEQQENAQALEAETQKDTKSAAGDSSDALPSAKVEVKSEPVVDESSVAKVEGDAVSVDVSIPSADSPPSLGGLRAAGKDAAARKRRSRGQGSKKGVCRTKARYKAQLKAGSASSSPLPGGASPSLQGVNTDSDNDSNGLVIDMPAN